MKFLTKIFLIYRCVIPFIGFLGVSFYLSDKIGIIAFTGWLAAMLYDYFFFIRFGQKVISCKEVISGLLVPLLVIISQLIRNEGGFWNFFIELALLEIGCLNLGLLLAFLISFNKARKDKIVGIFIMAFLFISISSISIFYFFLKAWFIINSPITYFTLTPLLIALILNTRDEYLFIDSIAKKKTDIDETFIDDNFMIIIVVIFAWMAIIPLVSFIIRKFI